MTLLKGSLYLFACCFGTFGLEVSGTQDEDRLLWDVADEVYEYGSGYGAGGAFPTDDEDDYQSNLNYYDSLTADNGLDNTDYDRGMVCGDGVKIGETKICNGEVDCFDCSDEENCPYDSHKIFMCYETVTEDQKPLQFTHTNPKCIALAKFCDGRHDCQNGTDEKQIGLGFRCQITDRFRECILPQRFLCDDMAHCEDHTDMCPGIWGDEGNSTQYDDSAKPVPEGLEYTERPLTLFQCLDKKLLISQKQLCDGNFDCYDLSDECLCDVYRSEIVEEVCGGLCARPIWRNQQRNPNCEFCNEGHIYWKSPLFLTDGRDRNMVEDECSCFSPDEIAEKVALLQSAKNKSSIESYYEVIDCLDIKFNQIRARKCDGRPECLSGEDECGIGCNRQEIRSSSGSGSGDFEYMSVSNSTDPEFCKLLTKDYKEFACLSWMDENGSRKPQFADILSPANQIVICDGERDCPDGSDEMFCPKRISCSFNSSAQSSDNTIQTFDEVQRCDGHRHCINGKDEELSECQSTSYNKFPCNDQYFSGKSPSTFTREGYLDGKRHCDMGEDESPPFFSKSAAIIGPVYGSRTEKPQIGISTSDAAIGNMALQTFLIGISLLGASALVVSLALGLYNVTVKWCKTESEKTRRSFVIYAREVVVYIGITFSKGLLCGFFAYIRIKRSEESNYSTIDLEWRSSMTCSIAGTIAMVGCQIPVLTLAVFVIAFLIFDSTTKKWRKRQRQKKNKQRQSTENGLITNRESKMRNGRRKYLTTVITCLGLVIIIWIPVVSVALLLHTHSNLHYQTETYGWVVSRGAQKIFQANLISQDNAMTFVSKLIAIAPNMTQIFEGSGLKTFSLADFPKIVNNISPRLRLESLGTFGYFSQSGSCLPAYLVHVTGGEAPFDIAVSNLGSISLSVLIMAVNFALIFCTGVLTTRYGAGISKICSAKSSAHDRHYILNSTFTRLVVIETLTWTVVTLSFLLKSIDPNIATDRTYTTICIVVIGTNCGIVTPFVLLMRKFRIQDATENNNDENRRSSKSCSDEESNERQPLTNETNPQLSQNTEQNEEGHSMKGNISDE